MRLRWWLTAGWGVVLASVVFPVSAQVNSYNSVSSGDWDDGTKWSLGVPPALTQSGIFITNAATKSVFLHFGQDTATFAISNLTVSAPAGATNTLSIADTAEPNPFRVVNLVTIGSGGALAIGSLARFEGSGGTKLVVNGRLTLNALSTVIVTNTGTHVGNAGTGTVVMSGGTLLSSGAIFGLGSGVGTLQMSGGTNDVNGSFLVGFTGTSTGTVWLTGGELLATNPAAQVTIGSISVGQMTISNGTFRTSLLRVGHGAGSRGTLTVAGGTNLNSSLDIGASTASTGAVFVTSGHLIATNNAGTGQLLVGNGGTGSLTISNGTVITDQLLATNGADSVAVLRAGSLTTAATAISNGAAFVAGSTPGVPATLQLRGGSHVLADGLQVATAAGSTGAVWMTGTQLLMTNATADVGRSGTGELTISNGTMRVATLFVGRLNGSRGTLTIAGGTNIVSGLLNIAAGGTATGAVWVTGSALIVTNQGSSLDVGDNGNGRLVVSNGTVLARQMRVGRSASSSGLLIITGGSVTTGDLLATNAGSQVAFFGGTLTVTNSTVITSAGPLTLGDAPSSAILNLPTGNHSYANGLNVASGQAWVGSGTVLVTTANLIVGNFGGVGQMTVSNGVVQARALTVGNETGFGTMTVAGGTVAVATNLVVSADANTTGTVWITGGQVLLTNASSSLTISRLGEGTMTISNGTMRAHDVKVGEMAGADGVWFIRGGTNSAYSSLVLGNHACTATGAVAVFNGRLAVTNAVTNAVLDVRSGTFLQVGGEVAIDRIVVTNSCGRFIHDGGLLFTNSAPVLAPFFDADGDGMHNQYEQDNGFDPFNPADAAQDADGDGATNLEELTAGTDPHDADSLLRIIAIAPEGSDMRVTWTTAAGRVYQLQGSTNVSFSAGVTNLSDLIYFFGPGESTTNAVHTGGATNAPAFFYRVSGQID